MTLRWSPPNIILPRLKGIMSNLTINDFPTFRERARIPATISDEEASNHKVLRTKAYLSYQMRRTEEMRQRAEEVRECTLRMEQQGPASGYLIHKYIKSDMDPERQPLLPQFDLHSKTRSWKK